MATAVISGRPPVAQEQRTPPARPAPCLPAGCAGGREAGAGVVDRREDLGERDAGMRLLAARPSAASTSSSVETSLASLVLLTWKPTTGWPLSRAKPRTSAEPSPTSATSDSLTNGRRRSGIVQVAELLDTERRAQDAQGLLAAAHARPGRPAASRLNLRRALLTCGRGQAAAASRSGSTSDVDLAVDAADAGDLGDAPARPAGRGRRCRRRTRTGRRRTWPGAATA